MITASHNPPEFNGIKCIDYDGTEMPREKEERIEAIYFNKTSVHKNWKSVGSIGPVEGVARAYSAAIKQHVDVNAIAAAKLNVVLDCANGAATATSPNLLADLGVRVVSLNANPQGTFPGHPSEPTADNLKDLMATVKATGADLGIAHDGDADRTIFVDDQGNFVFGDRSLAIVARHVIKQKGGGIVVTPVSTSSCVEDVVKAEGGEVIYTRVGSPVVARKMIEVGAVFGGEENGGLIFPEHQYCRDGGMTAAKMLEIVATEGLMSKLLTKIPEYCLDKRKMECPETRKEEVLARVVETFVNERVDTTDGIKVYFEEGWTLIRPSGTEPIFRIFSEAKSAEAAKKCGDRCEKALSEILK
jgi:phosphomannomutase/phosphoglucomutase